MGRPPWHAIGLRWISIKQHMPIGMLDSGVGGLAVARELLRGLPHERILYVGDTAHFPYGIRTAEQVVANVRAILDAFAQEGVKAAVLACNTASAVALPVLRNAYDFPILGVIEAGARMAVAQSRHGVVGVLATERTVQSGAYRDAVLHLAPHFQVLGREAPRLVTMVEEGYTETDPATLDEAIVAHLKPLLEKGADTIILGCTHFLAFRERIMRLFPGQAAVIDPAAETARQVAELLGQRHALASSNGIPRHRFLISGQDGDHFRQLGSLILGHQIPQVELFVPSRLPVK